MQFKLVARFYAKTRALARAGNIRAVVVRNQDEFVDCVQI